MKIVICGGHHNSALVVAEKFIEKGYEIIWFGRKYSTLEDKNFSPEFLEVNQKGIPFYEIKAGKFQPKYRFFQNLLRIPLGFLQSLYYLAKTKPDLILSFGGYLALPVAITGFFIRIPVVTHEQTTVCGLANQIIGKFSKKIFLSFNSSSTYIDSKKIVFTGLPIRKHIFTGEKIFKNSKMTIYITGGKQGAHVLNQAIFSVLPKLLENFNIIHQCGSTSLYNDIEKAKKIKKNLKKNSDHYLVKDYFFENEIGSVFKSADFVVSRAGAHTVYELLVLEKPAILIPIPWSHKNEQYQNALLFEKSGLGKIVDQSTVEKGKLLNEILDFSKNISQYRLKKDFPKPPLNAEEKIISEIEKILKKEREAKWQNL